MSVGRSHSYLDFKLSPCSLCRMFSFGGFPRRLNFKSRSFGTLYWSHLHRQVPMKMDPIQSSETSAFKTQTPVKTQKKTYYISQLRWFSKQVNLRSACVLQRDDLEEKLLELRRRPAEIWSCN
jgi:hypothetical protein